MWAAYTLVFLLGALIGFAELISRYRDDPGALFRIRAVGIYVVINGVISLAALYLIQVFDVVEAADGATLTTSTELIYEILLASFGGAAFFRSSIARAKAGDMEVAVGPSFLIENF
ncbi:MAG: hypothetical protein AAF675_03240 [Pseudomonadota bacterium]